MKFLTKQTEDFLAKRTSRQNAQLLLRLIGALIGLIFAYTMIFEYLMHLEGQSHSWPTALYWVFTNMSTLGLGDITFASDIGRIFNVVVLVSGMMFILVLLPFAFVQLFQSSARVPRELAHESDGHVILTHFGTVAQTLITTLRSYGLSYVIVVDNIAEALDLLDRGMKVVLGDLDDPETFRRVKVEQAALVTATGTDVRNTSIAFTIRRITQDVPIIATASSTSSESVLRVAGCNHVLTLDEMMGHSLARRTTGGDALAHVIGQFDDLTIAEATAAGTPLVGKTLRELKLRALVGATVIGVWEQGLFTTVTPDSIISSRTVLVLAGTLSQIDQYNELFAIYNAAPGRIIIVGGGNVGTAMGHALTQRELGYCIIEKDAERILQNNVYVHGDASHPSILEKAGINEAPAVAVTTHDDEVNIFLTAYIRHIHPNVQIISRATADRAVHTLHEAGADFVMSYASMGANSIFNFLKRGNILMVAEGVDVFRVPLPKSLVGKTIAQSSVREQFGCSIIGVGTGHHVQVNPDPETLLTEGNDVILIGTVEAEQAFLGRYGQAKEGR